jgi:PAS domain S-box-containing protein
MNPNRPSLGCQAAPWVAPFMLDQIANNPNLAKYVVKFQKGQNVFLEGDQTQEMYVLVSGKVDILKGDQVISQVAQPGAFFGEMSFLLGSNRTATVRARTDVEAICIPQDKISDFLKDFPEAPHEISRLLAKRLDRTSQLLFGLKELTDRLPDAVIISDGEGNMTAFNRAASKLYGKDWNQVGNTPVEEVYEDSEAYRALVAKARAGNSVVEAPLTIPHSTDGVRHLALSLSVLYDAQHNFQGVLAVARDVTGAVKNRQRLKRLRNWLFISLGLLAVVGAAALVFSPYMLESRRQVSQHKIEFRNLVAKDYVLMKSLLSKHLVAGNREGTSNEMVRFFELQDPAAVPYRGMVVLDRDKRVFDAHWAQEGNQAKKLVGSTYERLTFHGDEDSLHKVLVAYRKVPGGSSQSLEIAFEILEKGRLLGWVVFVLDPELLQKRHGMEQEELKGMHFKRR